jgi:hypothetical protein
MLLFGTVWGTYFWLLVKWSITLLVFGSFFPQLLLLLRFYLLAIEGTIVRGRISIYEINLFGLDMIVMVGIL